MTIGVPPMTIGVPPMTIGVPPMTIGGPPMTRVLHQIPPPMTFYVSIPRVATEAMFLQEMEL